MLADEIKNYNLGQLQELAGQLRERLVAVVRENGGHLASNLGVVELTLALHYVFNFSRDKLVFDVGHQSYAHKLLTGRDLSHVRRKGGESGFPDPEESPYDAFIAGHSGTSVGAGIGLCCARDAYGDDYKVVSFIGDASLGNGVALEAVFSADHKPNNFLVVLNDNGMSIDKNNSALYRALSKATAKKGYRDFNKKMRRTFKETSAFGKKLRKMKYVLKGWLNKNDFFERCGFKYVGPVDGHDLHELVSVLESIKDIDEPVLLHVITVKGKGFEAAEEDPARFHGVGQNFVGSNNSFAVALGRVLCARAAEDASLVAVTAAMTDGVGLSEFASLYPHRLFDVGICEEYAVAFAAGLAAAGRRPVVALYSTFAQRAVDNLMHDVCLPNLPVVLCLDRAGVVGPDGPTHHGLYDLAMLRALPNLEIRVPATRPALEAALDAALSRPGPTVIRYPRGYVHEGPAPRLPGASPDAPLILALGHTVFWAEPVAKALGLALEPVESVKPLPDFVRGLGARPLITLEDAAAVGGFGSAVAEVHRGPLLILGWPDRFVPQGSEPELRAACGLDAAGLRMRIAAFVGGLPGGRHG